MAIVDYNNPASYKNCSKKSYEIYVCKPPKDTVVINKLEQADAVKLLNGKTYFTVEELERMQKNGDGRFNLISQVLSAGKAYLVSDKTPFVLCGTIGEMWTVSADKLAKTYTFLQNGQPLQINQQSLNQRMKNGNLDWTLIRTSQQATSGQNMACFVPRAQKGQVQTPWGAVQELNGTGTDHGKGDFVVCSKLPNGKPNLVDRLVVNGNVFATTYNNQGWQDCLNANGIKNITIDSLPRLIPLSVVKNSIDFEQIHNCMEMSEVQGEVGIGHILDSVYEELDTDTIKARTSLCFNKYRSTSAGYGSASLLFAKLNPESIKGILNNSINAVDLFSSAVECCQNEAKRYTALSVLYKISYIIASNATVRLFFDNNKYTSKLWKNADAIYTLKGETSLHYYDKSKYSINKDRVCIDFHLSGVKEPFVRFFYTKSGSFSFKFLPKGDISNDEAGATYRFESFQNFLNLYEKLSSCFYQDLINVSNLDKYILCECNETVINKIGNLTYFLFRQISTGDTKYDSKDNAFKFTFNINGVERFVYLRSSDTDIDVRCKLDSSTFEKSYKVSIKHTCEIDAMLIFSDICKVFKLHPAKELLKSKRLWDFVIADVNNRMSGDNLVIKKLEPFSINLQSNKYEVGLRFYDSTDKVVGERVLVADFNYKNFNINNTCSKSLKALNQIKDVEYMSQIVVTFYYKYDSKFSFEADNVPTVISEDDMALTIYFVTRKLLNTYKKYQN